MHRGKAALIPGSTLSRGTSRDGSPPLVRGTGSVEGETLTSRRRDGGVAGLFDDPLRPARPSTRLLLEMLLRRAGTAADVELDGAEGLLVPLDGHS
jgi:hypothetical protein